MKPLERIALLELVADRPGWFTADEYRRTLREVLGHCFDSNLETRAYALNLLCEMAKQLIVNDPATVFKPPNKSTDAS